MFSTRQTHHFLLLPLLPLPLLRQQTTATAIKVHTNPEASAYVEHVELIYKLTTRSERKVILIEEKKTGTGNRRTGKVVHKYIGTQANKQTATEQKRYRDKQANRWRDTEQTGTQANMYTRTQVQRHTGKQARRYSGQQARGKRGAYPEAR